MNNYFFTGMAAVALMFSAGFLIPFDEYKIKDGYKIEFKSKDPSGSFDVKGNIRFDEKDLDQSKFDLTFPVATISTGNGMKNKKAQTSEWFDAAKYPDIKYSSTKIEKSGANYMVIGQLKIRGISKEYKVPLKVTKSGSELQFSGDFEVNRTDFKVGKPGGMVPNTLNISYSIPVTKK